MDAMRFREEVSYNSERDILVRILGMISARNVEDVAGRLIDTMGSLKNVLEARPEQLRRVDGVTEKTAEKIAAMLGIVRAWQRCNMGDERQIMNSKEAKTYCQMLLSGNRIEEFHVIALNAQCKIIGTRRISIGSLSEVSAYPRMVVETALNYNAHSVLFTHNHPGGTCAPSPEDIQSTLQIQRLLSGLGILVLDHIIVAGDRTYSMIEHGDIDYRVR